MGWEEGTGEGADEEEFHLRRLKKAQLTDLLGQLYFSKMSCARSSPPSVNIIIILLQLALGALLSWERTEEAGTEGDGLGNVGTQISISFHRFRLASEAGGARRRPPSVTARTLKFEAVTSTYMLESQRSIPITAWPILAFRPGPAARPPDRILIKINNIAAITCFNCASVTNRRCGSATDSD